MAFIVSNVLNALPSRFREYFYDSALLFENCSSKHYLEIRKSLVIADSVIVFDIHFVQLDLG